MHTPSPTIRARTSGESYGLFLDRFAQTGAIAVICVGTTVMLGWAFHIALLKGLLPGLAVMKVNTAIAFISAGAALWLMHHSTPDSWRFRFGRALAAFVAALGMLSFAENFVDLDLGTNQIFFADDLRIPPNRYPGLMSPASALSFIFLGLALLSLKARQQWLAFWAHWLLIPVLLISLLALLGYAYGVQSLYQIRAYSTMALHTALAFLLLALSILAADSTHGFARIATSDTAGGVVSRRLLPTLPLLLFGLGWLRLQGELAGLYDFSFGIAVMVLSSTIVCLIAVGSIAMTLHKTDLLRRDGEVALINLNAELEQRVRERTDELEAANSSLEQLAMEDGLTHLANRRFFDTYLEAQIAVAHRHQRTLALVLCDVDNFKSYNDQYGHQAGDECLKRVAQAIKSCCRRPADIAARYGGEEFTMILPETELAGAVQIAEAAREAVAQLRIPHARSSASPFIAISGGVSFMSGKTNMTASQLISEADQNLYQAKRLGRNRMISLTALPGAGHSRDKRVVVT